MAESKLRDKTYVAAKNMLFNVTGYQHPESHVYGSLKYIDGKKWTDGYAAATEFLRQENPDFVGGTYIQIPREQITAVYDPRTRWTELMEADERDQEVTPLHREALELAAELGHLVDLPLPDFGITDSLLWGDGHPESDIDLVIFGAKMTERILQSGERIYQHPDFERPDPTVMKAPYSLRVKDWPKLLARKMHMGAFRGRLFSLRVILSDADLSLRPQEKQSSSDHSFELINNEALIDFEITDVSNSLCFPATYLNSNGGELVDYSVVYEGVFRTGETVRTKCTSETIEFENGTSIRRFTITDGCQLVS